MVEPFLLIILFRRQRYHNRNTHTRPRPESLRCDDARYELADVIDRCMFDEPSGNFVFLSIVIINIVLCVCCYSDKRQHTHTHIDGIDDKPNKMYSILFWGGVNLDRAATLFTRTTSSHNVRLLWPLSIGLWMARQFSICHCHANWYRWTHAVEQQVIVAAWKKKGLVTQSMLRTRRTEYVRLFRMKMVHTHTHCFPSADAYGMHHIRMHDHFQSTDPSDVRFMSTGH